MRNFSEWLSSFSENIYEYTYFTDFKKAYKNAEKFKVELFILSSLTGSKDIEKDFRKILKEYPKTIQCIPILLAVRQNELSCRDGKGIKKYNFSDKNKAYDVEEIVYFMKETGLFTLLSKYIIKNVYDYVLGIEVGLDSNARKNRGGKMMEKVVENFLIKAGFVKGKTFFKEMYISEITKRWGLDLSKLSNKGKTEKRFDFVVKTQNTVYGIETNFYKSGGSKLNETARSYKTLALETRETNQFEFIWITDGQGWKSAKFNLQETFDVMEHIYNLNDLENGILKKVLK